MPAPFHRTVCIYVITTPRQQVISSFHSLLVLADDICTPPRGRSMRAMTERRSFTSSPRQHTLAPRARRRHARDRLDDDASNYAMIYEDLIETCLAD